MGHKELRRQVGATAVIGSVMTDLRSSFGDYNEAVQQRVATALTVALDASGWTKWCQQISPWLARSVQQNDPDAIAALTTAMGRLGASVAEQIVTVAPSFRPLPTLVPLPERKRTLFNMMLPTNSDHVAPGAVLVLQASDGDVFVNLPMLADRGGRGTLVDVAGDLLDTLLDPNSTDAGAHRDRYGFGTYEGKRCIALSEQIACSAAVVRKVVCCICWQNQLSASEIVGAEVVPALAAAVALGDYQLQVELVARVLNDEAGKGTGGARVDGLIATLGAAFAENDNEIHRQAGEELRRALAVLGMARLPAERDAAWRQKEDYKTAVGDALGMLLQQDAE